MVIDREKSPWVFELRLYEILNQLLTYPHEKLLKSMFYCAWNVITTKNMLTWNTILNDALLYEGFISLQNRYVQK